MLHLLAFLLTPLYTLQLERTGQLLWKPKCRNDKCQSRNSVKGHSDAAAHIVWKEIPASCCFFSTTLRGRGCDFFLWGHRKTWLWNRLRHFNISVNDQWLYSELLALTKHTVIHWNDQLLPIATCNTHLLCDPILSEFLSVAELDGSANTMCINVVLAILFSYDMAEKHITLNRATFKIL